MDNINEMMKCINFIGMYGWGHADEEIDDGSDFTHFCRHDEFDIDINSDEIVFIDDTGDFLHIPTTYYGLVGVLVSYRIIPYNF
jgi:hypothetical protein